MTILNKVIIIGSGIGGLCAAAALSPLAKQVTIYCKDQRPATPASRKSVPQGNHISILLQAGLNNLASLLPGIHAELILQGSAQIRAGSGQQIFEHGRWSPERDLDLLFLGQSRPFLEHQIYQRVVALNNVYIKNNTSVQSLVISENNCVTEVNGIDAQKNEFTASADLFIDASGISGKLSQQVQHNIEQELSIDTLDIGIYYSTVHFKKTDAYINQKENILIIPEAGKNDMGGSLIDIEDNTWCVSLHGRNHASPPKTMDEWLLMAKNLANPRIWERVQSAKASSTIQTFKKPTSYWRHYEQCTNLPKGYIPLGDTINSLNPIFGQGMTVAISHALALRQAFASKTEKSPRDLYFKAALIWTKMAWEKTKAYDENFTKIAGMSEKQIQFLYRLAETYHQRTITSADFHLQHIQQSQML